ncbi:MAG: hypothetical protein ACP5DC_08605 [Halothiobacillaceae bacterium]
MGMGRQGRQGGREMLAALLLAGLLPLTAWGGDAFLPDDPDRERANLDLQRLDERFIQAPGWQVIDPGKADARLAEALADADDPASPFPFSASLDPLTKAVALLQTREPPTRHARYQLRYGLVVVEPEGAGPPLWVSVVEVRRYNLGQARRQTLIESMGAEVVAPEAAFEVGPHVAYRLLAHPLRGNAAILAAISRRTIDDATATRKTCLGQPCLTADSINETRLDWEPLEQWDFDPTTRLPDWPVAGLVEGLLIRHHVAAIEDGRYNWRGFEPVEVVAAGEPFVEILIERNLGQDDGLDGLLDSGPLMDDMVRRIHERLLYLPGVSGTLTTRDVQYWPSRRLKVTRDCRALCMLGACSTLRNLCTNAEIPVQGTDALPHNGVSH